MVKYLLNYIIKCLQLKILVSLTTQEGKEGIYFSLPL